MDADRIFVNSKGKAYKTPGDDRTDYIRGDMIRDAISGLSWQVVVKHAMSKPGIPQAKLKALRDLVEEGR